MFALLGIRKRKETLSIVTQLGSRIPSVLPPILQLGLRLATRRPAPFVEISEKHRHTQEKRVGKGVAKRYSSHQTRSLNCVLFPPQLGIQKRSLLVFRIFPALIWLSFPTIHGLSSVSRFFRIDGFDGLSCGCGCCCGRFHPSEPSSPHDDATSGGEAQPVRFVLWRWPTLAKSWRCQFGLWELIVGSISSSRFDVLSANWCLLLSFGTSTSTISPIMWFCGLLVGRVAYANADALYELWLCRFCQLATSQSLVALWTIFW